MSKVAAGEPCGVCGAPCGRTSIADLSAMVCSAISGRGSYNRADRAESKCSQIRRL